MIEYISGLTCARAIFFITFLLTAIIWSATRFNLSLFIAITACDNIIKLAVSSSHPNAALRAAGAPLRPGRPLIRNYTDESKSNHCMKSVRIRSYSGSYFPAFGLNTERYSVYRHVLRNEFLEYIFNRTVLYRYTSQSFLKNTGLCHHNQG